MQQPIVRHLRKAPTQQPPTQQPIFKTPTQQYICNQRLRNTRSSNAHANTDAILKHLRNIHAFFKHLPNNPYSNNDATTDLQTPTRQPNRANDYSASQIIALRKL